MLFKTTALQAHWPLIHPAVRIVLGELDEQLDAWGLSSLMVTDAQRTPEEQEDNYWRHYRGQGYSEADARERARNRFSWHLCNAAADFRSSGVAYSDQEQDRILEWLRMKCPKPFWEVLFHDVGKGAHFHVAHRDFLWRRDWEQAQRRAVT